MSKEVKPSVEVDSWKDIDVLLEERIEQEKYIERLKMANELQEMVDRLRVR